MINRCLFKWVFFYILVLLLFSCSDVLEDFGVVRSINISPDSAKVISGEAFRFQATAIMADGTNVDITDKALWKTSDTGDITFSDSTGNSGTAESKPGFTGQVEISITFDGKSSTAILNVEKPTITVASVNNSKVVTKKGGSLQIYASGGTEPYSYSIEGDEIISMAIATIDSNTGVLIGKNVGTVSVKAVDANLFSGSIEIDILAYTLPFVTSLSSFDVYENVATVGLVTATDNMFDTQFSYSIVGGVDESLFLIDQTGLLSFNAEDIPDFELPIDIPDGNNKYEVTVQVSNPAGSSLQDVTVETLNVADQLDLTFNVQGYVTHHNAAGGSAQDSASDLVVVPDGKVLVVGYSWAAQGGYDMVVWRFNTDGSLDSGFGDFDPTTIDKKKGIMVHHDAGGGAGNDFGNGVALTPGPDGKIIVVGSSRGDLVNNFGTGMAVWRLNHNGSLDSTFGAGQGYVVYYNTAGGGKYDIANGVAVTPGGKIVVVGNSYLGPTANDYLMAVWRLNPNGSLDSTFGGGKGYVTYRNVAGSGSGDSGNRVAIAADGKIVIAGDRLVPGYFDMAVWRLNVDGSLDTTFGGSKGYVTRNTVAGTAKGIVLTSGPDSKIVVAGYSDEGPINRTDMAVWRLNLDGSFDSTFGEGKGYVTHHNAAEGGGGYDGANDITITSDGKILISGYSASDSTNQNDMALWRLNPDGSLDTTFGGKGYLTHHNAALGDGKDSSNGLAIAFDGRIVAVGDSESAGTTTSSKDLDMAVWSIW